MGICLCTQARAQAFARQKVNARHRKDELLTTVELAIMISDVYFFHKQKAATYIVQEHRRLVEHRRRINTPTYGVSSVSLPSSVFSSRRRGRRANRRCLARPARVLRPRPSVRQPAVAMVLDKEDTRSARATSVDKHTVCGALRTFTTSDTP